MMGGQLKNLQGALISFKENIEVKNVEWDVKTWKSSFGNILGNSIAKKFQRATTINVDDVKKNLKLISTQFQKTGNKHKDDLFTTE